MRPLLRRLSDSVLFGALFAVIPQMANIALSCSGRGPSCVRWGVLELGFAYFITGMLGWLLFASAGRLPWQRAMVLGLLLALVAPAAYWGLVWFVIDPNYPHGMGYVSIFVLAILPWTMPAVAIFAVMASTTLSWIGSRRGADTGREPVDSLRRALAAAVGYGALVFVSLACAALAFPAEFTLQMASGYLAGGVAFAVPTILWLGTFARKQRADYRGVGLVILVTVPVIHLTAVALASINDGDAAPYPYLEGNWPARVIYWAMLNLWETSAVAVPLIAGLTLIYAYLVNQRRSAAESIDRRIRS